MIGQIGIGESGGVTHCVQSQGFASVCQVTRVNPHGQSTNADILDCLPSHTAIDSC